MPASDISDISPAHSVNYDGQICDEPRNRSLPPDIDSERARIATFAETLLMHDGNRLAAAGFYYTGNGTIVRCFRCGRCVHSFNENDNPRHARWHGPECDQVEAASARPRNYSGEHSVHSHAEIRGRNRSIGPADELPHSSNVPSSSRDTEGQTSGAHGGSGTRQATGGAQARIPTQRNIAAGGNSGVYEAFACVDPHYPNMADTIRRADTFGSGWPARLQATPEDLARAGFFYTDLGDRVRCWYCGEVLGNWNYEDDPWIEHAKWYPTCEHVLRHKGPDFVQGIVAQFPNLQRPVRQPAPVQPLRQAAQPPAPPPPPPGNQVNQLDAAGGGGVHRIGGTTIYYPEGGGMVITTRSGKIIRNNPAGNVINIINTNRRRRGGVRLGGNNNQPPQFVDPRQNIENYESLVQDTMTNAPMVQNLREMGYQDDAIKIVLLGKLQSAGELYENIDEFIDALIQYQEELDRIAPGPSSENRGQEASSGPSTSAGSSEQATNTPVEQLRRLEESRNCRICHRERATVVLIPCGHVAICENCSERNISICPICKRMVTEKIRSFMA